MSKQNKALVRRWIEEIFNQGSMATVDEIVAAKYVHHDPLMPDIHGREALKQLVATLRAAFPDLRYTVDDLIEEGDKVVMRWTFRGTHRVQYLGVAATNSLTEITGTTTLRLAQGRVAEHWFHCDSLGWMQRVGAVTTALIQRWIEEVLNKGNLAVVDEIWVEDAVFCATLIPEVRGRDAVKQVVAAIRKAFPDIHYSIVGEPVVQGDWCSCRWTAGGTHRGEFMGTAPTGKYITHTGTGTVRVRGGKLAEHYSDWDALGVMQQLGVAPAVGQLMATAAAAGR